MYVDKEIGFIIIDHISLINPQRKITDKQKEFIDKITDYLSNLRNKNKTKNETNQFS